MKLNYYPETDSLYIDLSEQPRVEREKFRKMRCLTMMLMVNLLALTSIMPAAKWKWRN